VPDLCREHGISSAQAVAVTEKIPIFN